MSTLTILYTGDATEEDKVALLLDVPFLSSYQCRIKVLYTGNEIPDIPIDIILYCTLNFGPLIGINWSITHSAK